MMEKAVSLIQRVTHQVAIEALATMQVLRQEDLGVAVLYEGIHTVMGKIIVLITIGSDDEHAIISA